MAFRKGVAGQSTRRLSDKRYLARVLIALIGLISIVLIISLMPNLKGIAGIIVVIIALLAMKRIGDLTIKESDEYKRLEKRAVKGFKAEEKIGDILDQLPNDYAVFHDIESPYGNIDHVVLNKKDSIFLLETKSHSGEVTYNGESLMINGAQPEKDFISQILRNTFWLRDKIKEQTNQDIFIKPIMVFTNAFVRVKNPIKGVSIINKKYLTNIILEHKDTKILERTPHKLGLFTVLQRLQKNNPSGVS